MCQLPVDGIEAVGPASGEATASSRWGARRAGRCALRRAPDGWPGWCRPASATARRRRATNGAAGRQRYRAEAVRERGGCRPAPPRGRGAAGPVAPRGHRRLAGRTMTADRTGGVAPSPSDGRDRTPVAGAPAGGLPGRRDARARPGPALDARGQRGLRADQRPDARRRRPRRHPGRPGPAPPPGWGRCPQPGGHARAARGRSSHGCRRHWPAGGPRRPAPRHARTGHVRP